MLNKPRTSPKASEASNTQNEQELAQLYSEAGVLINSTYEDTFPTVNIEALACGTPVIMYRTGGSPETIDEKTGMMIEQGNETALANAIMVEIIVHSFK